MPAALGVEQQRDADQRIGPQVEAARRLFEHQVAGTLRRRQMIDVGEAALRVRASHDGRIVTVKHDVAAQHFVAAHNLVQRPLQGRSIERTVEPCGQRHVVSG